MKPKKQLGTRLQAIKECRYPTHKVVHELFEEQVAKHSSDTAVVCEEKSLSYKALNEKSNQLAHYLREAKQVNPDDLIAVLCDRSIEMMVCILGILKAGGAYVPLDPSYPSKRIKYILENSKAPIVLTKKCLTRNLPETNAEIVLVDVDDDVTFICYPTSNLSNVTQPRNLIYVMYTSGTTGNPKGVMIEHEGCVVRLLHMIRENEMSPADHFLCILNFAFDASFANIFCTLLCGSTLYITKHSFDITEIKTMLFRHHITICHFVPSQFSLLKQHVDFNQLHWLTKLIFSGEAFDSKLFDSLLDKQKLILNYYGPTEAGEVTLNKFKLKDLSKQFINGHCILGSAFDQSDLFVLDKDACILSDRKDSEGELGIAGVALARGYLNKPALTAKKFVDISHYTKDKKTYDKQRVYKTGDLVKYRNGKLIYINRIDNQIKLRGIRVELNEIEIAIREHPAIRDVIVMARKDTANDQKLVAYVLLTQHSLPLRELRAYLKDKLPIYMIPSALIKLASFPLTLTGKVDKAALPKPIYNSNENLISPQTNTEKKLVDIWKKVLKVQQIGANDDFFHLGGDSLIATKMAVEILEYYNVRLGIEDILTNTTIADLASKIDSLPRTKNSNAAPLSYRKRSIDVPLTASQNQIWLHMQEANNLPIYNENFTIIIHEKIDLLALEKSINAMVEHHTIFRSRFYSLEGGPAQKVVPHVYFKINYVDFSSVKNYQKSFEQYDEICTQTAKKPFDLQNENPIRFICAKFNDCLYKLFIVVHHIACDGITIAQIFLSSLTEIYQHFSKGAIPNIPQKSPQYIDYAIWAKDQGVKVTQEERFWRKNLEGCQDISFGKNTVSKNFTGGKEVLDLGETLTEKLLDFSYEQGMSRFTILMAVFNVLLFKITGQTDIVVLSPVSLRNRKWLEPIAGNFLNSVLFRNKLTSYATFHDFLAKVHKNALEIYKYQEFPLQKIASLFKNKAPISVGLSIEPAAAGIRDNWDLKQLEVDTGTTKFSLSIELNEKPKNVTGYLRYSKDIFEQSFIHRLAIYFKNILATVVANPCVKILDINIFDQQERHQLLFQWNDTTKEYPAHKTVHELFEEQAKQHASKTAMVCGKKSLSYKAFNEKANQLAHYLRKEKQTTPDNLIAVLCDRSIEMMVCILGILKAGGAYVPLDPDYPTERIKHILEDTKTSVVLTKKGLTKNLPATSAEIVFLDDDTMLKRYPTSNLTHVTQSDNLMYVMYTSGTTGKPKGVMIEHKNVSRLILAQTYISISSTSVLAQASNASFDAATFEIWGALLHGAKLVIISKKTLLSTKDYSNTIHKEGINILFLTSALFKKMVDKDQYSFSNVDFLLFGGERIPYATIKKARASFAGRLIHVYGPTESTTFTTAYEIKKDAIKNEDVPIGKPLSNTKVYILDSDLNPVPIGVPGQLYISGGGLTRGYLNQPKMTEDHFIPNPFLNKKEHQEHSNSKLYRTGDLCKWLEDGNIQYVGRLDDQIKIRGFRIELAEITSILYQHPEVEHCIVIVREDITDEKRLVAYVLLRSDNTTPESLKIYLLSKLPEYMIPYVVVVEHFKLTANGKIDKSLLPKPTYQSTYEYVAPRTDLEKVLSQALKETLNINKIGVYDHFFDVGLDSLRIFQFIESVNKQGVNISFQHLHSFNNIAALARSLTDDLGVRRFVYISNQSSNLGYAVIFIPGAGGSMKTFDHLIKKINYSGTFGCLQPLKNDLTEIDIQAIATKLAKNLQEEIPKKRYILIGHSFGAVLSYEIAQILGSNQVPLLFMLDTSPMISKIYKIEGNFYLEAFAILAVIHGIITSNDYVKFLEKIHSLSNNERIEYLEKKSGNVLTEQQIAYFIELYILSMRKISSYHYTRNQYEGRMVFCKAEDQFLFKNSPVMFEINPNKESLHENGEFRNISESLETAYVSGDHVSMLREPYVISLSKIINERLGQLKIS